MTLVKTPKKLIEVALPLDAINVACAREKSIRHGHPGTLHLWWARRPLAAARAVIFAQMVNDPGYERNLGRGVNKEKAEAERERLFKIVEDLVQWENTDNEGVLNRARDEIWRSWRETCALNRNHPQASELFNPDVLPGFHDPFAGGGALPLEAQRLGLVSYASDLNPVAVTINKAMIEIPPKFGGRLPVGPEIVGGKGGKKDAIKDTVRPGRDAFEDWVGAKGLTEDVRRYGAWMRSEAERRIGYLYPKIEVTPQMGAERTELRALVGQQLTPIAWLWARTVICPNPACCCVTPLLSSFVLSSKKDKATYLIPTWENEQLKFNVANQWPDSQRDPSKGFKRGMSGIFECIKCGTVTTRDYTAKHATTKGLGSVLTAVVCETKSGRIYLPADCSAATTDLPTADTQGLDIELSPNPRDVWCRNFGLNTPKDLFTPRQLVALTTISGLVADAIEKCKQDAISSGVLDDGKGLDSGGLGATAYAQAVGVYLSIAVDKTMDYNTSLVAWSPTRDQAKTTFGRQALPMVWDFAEVNMFAGAAGDLDVSVAGICRAMPALASTEYGVAEHADAQTQKISSGKVVSTDPPYYDNIGYADLSDFFYVWLRKCLRPIFPSLYATLAVPKADELVATPYRHGSRDLAEAFFLDGMTAAMHNIAEQSHPAFPVTIYYAFKQAETTGTSGTSSTGWETFLAAVLKAGFTLTGTWPMRTERDGRSIGIGTNALASSIVLVCRKRAVDAPTVSRREFIRELNSVLPSALDEMTRGGVNSPVAPVDLSQAIIGPGMAIFSQYSAVLEADGTPMTVRSALQLINRFFAEDDFEHDTQFCLSWFEQHEWDAGKYGEADVLARAKGTSVNGLIDAGVVDSSGGNLRLLKWAELPGDWSPEIDARVPVWEALHHLIRALNQEGETAAGLLLARMPEKTDAIIALTYRLYTLCERQGWAEEARAYNELKAAWSGIEQASREAGHVHSQSRLDV